MSDYIERQKVKDIRFSGGINHDGFLYVPYKELVDGIKALPSASVLPYSIAPDGTLTITVPNGTYRRICFEAKRCVPVEYIKSFEPADVAPVRHSRWIKTADGAECENCGREAVYQIVDDHWEYEPWCPHCGAKMDGERKE